MNNLFIPSLIKKTISIHLAMAALLFVVGTMESDAQPYLNIQQGVALSWPTTTSNTYQLQWSSSSSNSWNALGVPITGDGTTNSLYDPAPRGARTYRVLEIVPGAPAASGIPANGGFEFGSGTTASNWSVTTAAGGPVYAVRTNDLPHGGSFNFEVYLASTGAIPGWLNSRRPGCW